APRVAGSNTPAQTNYADLARTRAAPGNRTPDGSARAATFASNPAAGQGRFAGRAALPSASYYVAARSAGNSSPAGDRVAQAASYRGSTAVGYGYGRGNAGSASVGDQVYRTALPSRGYASSNYAGSRQAMARPGSSVAPRSYASRATPSYPQQRFA